jgi:hypothetical protein
MGTYAVIGDVQARLAGRPTFSAATKPTREQVEAWIDEAEAYLTGTIVAAGSPMPDATTGGGKIVRSLTCDYAEAHARMAHASAGGDGGNDDGKDLLDKFYGKLAEISREATRWASMLASGAEVEGATKIRGSNSNTAADDYIAPEFERGEVW